MSPSQIPGGYFLKARKIENSAISEAPPHVREIWDYFLRKANFKDHGKISRGELLTSYDQICNDLKWFVGYRKCKYSRSQCETATKWLTKHGMITTTRTTRGMIVTIHNYLFYQDPKNYENHSEIVTRTAMEPQWSPTIRKEGEEREECNNTICPPKPADGYSDDFNEFWKHYPKKVQKGAAWKAWKKIKAPKETLSKIQTALIWQKRSIQWLKNNGQFIPNPATYLNARQWEDENGEPGKRIESLGVNGCKI